jgi:hypothetical protein
MLENTDLKLIKELIINLNYFKTIRLKKELKAYINYFLSFLVKIISALVFFIKSV